MAYYHRKHDPEFAKQWDEAREYGIEMLHARAFQRALEGDLEPVYYMGVVVGYMRKFDSKLQIEMLRAYRPDRFKTAGVNVNVGVRGDVFVLTEEQRLELQRINATNTSACRIRSKARSTTRRIDHGANHRCGYRCRGGILHFFTSGWLDSDSRKEHRGHAVRKPERG
jgi:hypothetical protein